MQLLTYIWRNVKRNKLRSGLTMLSVGFSLALLTVLHGYMQMQAQWQVEAAADKSAPQNPGESGQPDLEVVSESRLSVSRRPAK